MALTDEAARAEVRTNFDANLVVEAGAGTGKTTLLVDRAAHAITVRQVPVNQLVLITFMEKAADELRDRLRGRLQEIMSAPGGDAAWVRSQLHDLPRAPITTLHGLGHRLVRSRSLELLGVEEPEVWDAVETDRQWGLAFTAWLAEHEAARRQFAHLGALGIRFGVWQRLLATLPEDGAWTWGDDEPEPVGELAPAWAAAMMRLGDRADALRIAADEPGAIQIRALRDQARILVAMPKSAWASLLLVLPLTAPKGSQARWKPYGDALREQKAELQAWQGRVVAWRQAWAGSVLRDLMEEARSLQAYWARWRRQAGAVTFGDQIELAVGLLRRDRPLRSRLAESFRHLLVDEFQDTDPLQVEMVQWLAAAPGSETEHPDRVVVPPGRLVLVGDVKQSIYRFRGADVWNAKKWMDQLVSSGQARLLQITDNFRSHQAIIDMVNQVFPPLMDGHGPNPPYIPLAPARPRVEGGPTRVWCLSVESKGADAVREEEAELAARWMAQAVSDRWPILTAAGTHRPIEPRDMALLLPRRTGLDAYREALARHGLPVLAAGARRFYARPEIRGLAAVLRAVVLPEDRPAVLTALESRWMGVSDAELGSHVARGGSWHPLDPQPPGPVAARLADLKEWLQSGPRRGAAGVLAEAIRRCPPQDPEVAANVDKLLEQAWSYGSRWGLRAYSEWLWARVTASEPEEEAEVAGLGGVRLTSIHQAKGLEWPLVVVAGLKGRGTSEAVVLADRRARLMAAKVAGVPSAHWDTVRAAIGDETEAEDRRLWYVAFTRPRDYLAVTSALPGLLMPLLDALPTYGMDEPWSSGF